MRFCLGMRLGRLGVNGGGEGRLRPRLLRLLRRRRRLLVVLRLRLLPILPTLLLLLPQTCVRPKTSRHNAGQERGPARRRRRGRGTRGRNRRQEEP